MAIELHETEVRNMPDRELNVMVIKKLTWLEKRVENVSQIINKKIKIYIFKKNQTGDIRWLRSRVTLSLPPVLNPDRQISSHSEYPRNWLEFLENKATQLQIKKWPMECRNCGELIRGTKEPWTLPRRESPDHRRSNEKGERGKAWRKKKRQNTCRACENNSPKPFWEKVERYKNVSFL